MIFFMITVAIIILVVLYFYNNKNNQDNQDNQDKQNNKKVIIIKDFMKEVKKPNMLTPISNIIDINETNKLLKQNMDIILLDANKIKLNIEKAEFDNKDITNFIKNNFLKNDYVVFSINDNSVFSYINKICKKYIIFNNNFIIIINNMCIISN